MDPVERAANLSVGRACAFASLAILCVMVGFSFQPDLSGRVGGFFALLASVVLLVKAWFAPTKPYRDTETWLILNGADRPPPETAQQLIGQTLRRIFLEYARFAAVLAIILLGASFALGLIARP
jgi:flagellar biosynthesis protein FliR